MIPQTSAPPMPVTELLSLASSIASLVLAVVAICLSAVFYRWSSAAAERSTDAAKSIGATVERLEQLFDKLYSDTFGMVKDTVSDMRKHMWPADTPEQTAIVSEIEMRTAERVNELKRETSQELRRLLESQTSTNDRIMALTKIVDSAISSSARAPVAAREETLREHILRAFQSSPAGTYKASDIVEAVSAASKVRFSHVVNELGRMHAEGVLMYNTGTSVPPDTIMSLVTPTAPRSSRSDV